MLAKRPWHSPLPWDHREQRDSFHTGTQTLLAAILSGSGQNEKAKRNSFFPERLYCIAKSCLYSNFLSCYLKVWLPTRLVLGDDRRAGTGM